MQLRLNGVFAKRRLATVFAESTDCKIARFDFYDFVMSPRKTTRGKIRRNKIGLRIGSKLLGLPVTMKSLLPYNLQIKP